MNEEISEFQGFIVTKPLQLLVVLAMLEQLPIANREILIVDSFVDARQVANRLQKHADRLGRVICIPSHDAAFKHCFLARYNRLYVDSDVGFRKNLELIAMRLSGRTKFSVYEEGLGTYREDLYSGFRKNLLSCMGAGTYFGGNWLTSEVYVYNSEEYRKKFERHKSIEIKCNITTLFRKRTVELLDLFNVAETLDTLSRSLDRNVSLYLASWDIDEAALSSIRNESGLTIVKGHPHRKLDLDVDESLIVVPSGIPAEVLVLAVLDIFDSIKIYHHGSSIPRYLQNEKLEYILLAPVVRTSFK